MPRKPVEFHEWKEHLDHAVERVRLADGKNAFPAWTRQLSLTTAVIAVLTAIGSLGAEFLSHRALLCKNDMVYSQAKASDLWAYYQAKGIKGLLSSGFADSLANSDPRRSESYRANADRYKDEQTGIKQQADAMEGNVHRYNEQADVCMRYHHDFSIAVTLFQVAIALSAIAVLIWRRSLWLIGLGISVIGSVFLLNGLAYFLKHT
jgi:uncharacterized protein DUF4337